MGLFSQEIVGVDIGHSSVKVVALKIGKTPVFWGCKEIPFEGHYLQKDSEADPLLAGRVVLEAMKGAAPHTIKTRSVYASVSELLVFRKVFDLPLLEDPDELKEAIRIEAASFLPEPLEQMQLDYQLLEALPDAKVQQVMVVAVNRQVINNYQAVFSAVHLNLMAVDVKSAAIGRALVGDQEKQALLLVDIGSEVSSISLHVKGSVQITGTINMGARIFRNPDTNEIDQERLPTAVKKLCEALVDEIDHVVKYYSNRGTGGEMKIKEIRLSGGGSLATGLLEQLKSVVDMAVVYGKPIIAVPPFCDRRFIGALGCALYAYHANR